MEDVLLLADANAGSAECQGIAELDVPASEAEGVAGFFGEEDDEVCSGDVVEVGLGGLGVGGLVVEVFVRVLPEPGYGGDDVVVRDDGGSVAGVVDAA